MTNDGFSANFIGQDSLATIEPYWPSTSTYARHLEKDGHFKNLDGKRDRWMFCRFVCGRSAPKRAKVGESSLESFGYWWSWWSKSVLLIVIKLWGFMLKFLRSVVWMCIWLFFREFFMENFLSYWNLIR